MTGKEIEREILFSNYLAFRSVSSSSDLDLSPGSGIFGVSHSLSYIKSRSEGLPSNPVVSAFQGRGAGSIP